MSHIQSPGLKEVQAQVRLSVRWTSYYDSQETIFNIADFVFVLTLLRFLYK